MTVAAAEENCVRYAIIKLDKSFPISPDDEEPDWFAIAEVVVAVVNSCLGEVVACPSVVISVVVIRTLVKSLASVIDGQWAAEPYGTLSGLSRRGSRPLKRPTIVHEAVLKANQHRL